MSIAFRDHEGFHRAAVAMAGLGAAAGVTVDLLSRLSVLSGALPPALLGGAVGAVLGRSLAEGRGHAARLGARLLLVAAGGAALTAVPGWAGLALLAVATALALHVGSTARMLAVGAAVGTAALLAASFAALRIAGAEQTASWSPLLVSACGGAAMAFVAVIALLPRHLGVDRDPIAVAAAALPAGLDPEVRELVARGRSVWTEVQGRLAADHDSRALVREGVLRLVDVAGRSAAVPIDLASAETRIAGQAADLDARIAAASDEVARAQYRQARAALDGQRRDLDAIRTGRDRLVARMHNYLAGLERFRLAVLKHQAVSASRLAAEARPLLGEVAELAAELDAVAVAEAEVEAIEAEIVADVGAAPATAPATTDASR